MSKVDVLETRPVGMGRRLERLAERRIARLPRAVRNVAVMAAVAAVAWSGAGDTAHAADPSAESGYEPYIAGTTPGQRPPTAPTIREYDRPEGWYDKALEGISRPYPQSLSFLEDQEAWYTPFIHPGIPGWYDIRDMHEQTPERREPRRDTQSPPS